MVTSSAAFASTPARSIDQRRLPSFQPFTPSCASAAGGGGETTAPTAAVQRPKETQPPSISDSSSAIASGMSSGRDGGTATPSDVWMTSSLDVRRQVAISPRLDRRQRGWPENMQTKFR